MFLHFCVDIDLHIPSSYDDDDDDDDDDYDDDDDDDRAPQTRHYAYH